MIIKGFCKRVDVIIYSFKYEFQINDFLSLGRAWINHTLREWEKNRLLHHFKQFKSQFEPLDDIADEMHIRIDTQKPLKENMAQILAHDYSLLSTVITGEPKDEL